MNKRGNANYRQSTTCYVRSYYRIIILKIIYIIDMNNFYFDNIRLTYSPLSKTHYISYINNIVNIKNFIFVQPVNYIITQLGSTTKNNMKSDQHPKYNGKEPSYFFVTVAKLNQLISTLKYVCGRISNGENVLALYIVVSVETNLIAITNHVL